MADYDLVVSQIYDAALSPGLWEAALTQLVDRFAPTRWDNAMLLWERIAPPGGRFVGWAGVHAVARQGYLHTFAGNNPWSVRGHDLAIGTVLRSDQMVPRDELVESQFYRDFLGTFSFDAGVLGLLDRQGDSHLCLCLPGPYGESTERLETALRLLLPHIQRAVRISRRIGEAELSAATSRTVLEATPSAVIMCNADMTVTYMNPAAERLVEADYLQVNAAKLYFAESRLCNMLRTLGGPDSRARCRAFMLDQPGKTPVGFMAVRADDNQLMLIGAHNHRSSPESVERLGELYKLTPAEARLAATLAEGASMEDFAATRGISMNTAKFLLKGVFSKTGARRQGALVAQLRSLPLDWQPAEPNQGLASPL